MQDPLVMGELKSKGNDRSQIQLVQLSSDVAYEGFSKAEKGCEQTAKPERSACFHPALNYASLSFHQPHRQADKGSIR